MIEQKLLEFRILLKNITEKDDKLYLQHLIEVNEGSYNNEIKQVLNNIENNKMINFIKNFFKKKKVKDSYWEKLKKQNELHRIKSGIELFSGLQTYLNQKYGN